MVFFLSGLEVIVSVRTGGKSFDSAQAFSGISGRLTVKNLKRRAFNTTETEEKLMAAAAIIGFRVRPAMP